MESGAESSGHLGIKAESVVGIIQQILRGEASDGTDKIFRKKTEEEMMKKQPDLFIVLSRFSRESSDPDHFKFGSNLAFATVSEEQRNIRLNKRKLTTTYKNPDLETFEDMLKEDYPDFIKAIKSLQEMFDATDTEAGKSFYKGVILTLLPFYRRATSKDVLMLENLFKKIDTTSPTTSRSK